MVNITEKIKEWDSAEVLMWPCANAPPGLRMR
jgi:hypothetical protein